MMIRDGKAGAGSGRGPTFMCVVCGYISIGKIPVKCPGCGAGRSDFKKVA
jgi:rubrerythrin